MSHEPPTRVDEKIKGFENHPILAPIIVCALVIIALASFIEAMTKVSEFVPKIAKAFPSGPVRAGEWMYAIVPESGAYKGQIQGSVTAYAPRRHEIIPEAVETSAEWATGGGGLGWGEWNGSPVLSPDRTVATATYCNHKHDRAVKIGIRAHYKRVWTSEDSVLVSIATLALAFIVYVFTSRRSRRGKGA